MVRLTFTRSAEAIRRWVDIEAMRIYRGRLSPRLEREVLRWAEVRQTELRVAWRQAQSHRPLGKIAPPD